MIILLHSSKTMRSAPLDGLDEPEFIKEAKVLANYLKTLSVKDLAKCMQLSPALAVKTHKLVADWSESGTQTSAIDSFLGDIYSGLQVNQMTTQDRQYANKVLYILSGLYGVLHPLDGICPYRLEMGYKLPNPDYANLCKYWGDKIARLLPKDGPIVNLAAAEYSKVVLPYVMASRVIEPKFMTSDTKTNQPKFVVVHAKVARGAFARWLIQNRINDVNQLKDFDQIGYKYDAKLSTPKVPVFVCKDFGGIGLSVRLIHK